MTAAFPVEGRAFTLVECLAVAALLALCAGVLAAGLRPASASALSRARSDVLVVDARGRELALRGSPVQLTLDAGQAAARAAGDEAPAIARTLPSAARAQLYDAATGDAIDAVRIDGRGRSSDYVISIRVGGRTSETLVAGLTGFAMQHREEGG